MRSRQHKRKGALGEEVVLMMGKERHPLLERDFDGNDATRFEYEVDRYSVPRSSDGQSHRQLEN